MSVCSQTGVWEQEKNASFLPRSQTEVLPRSQTEVWERNDPGNSISSNETSELY